MVYDNTAESYVHLEFIDAKPCDEEVKSWNVPSHRGSWVTYYKLFVVIVCSIVIAATIYFLEYMVKKMMKKKSADLTLCDKA